MTHEEHPRPASRPLTAEDGAPASDRPGSPARGISEGARDENAVPPPLPWLEWAPGERVVVRYRLADGLHDALGDLRETAVDHVVVRTRRGDVRVEASTMVTGKRVPPPPSAIGGAQSGR